jgi:hypothetical protein
LPSFSSYPSQSRAQQREILPLTCASVPAPQKVALPFDKLLGEERSLSGPLEMLANCQAGPDRIGALIVQAVAIPINS